MSPEEFKRAEECVAYCTDILSLVQSYNIHKSYAKSYRDPNYYMRDTKQYPAWGDQKCDEQAHWHETVFSLLESELEKEGLFVSVPSFFDNTTFEPAPGLIIKKAIDCTFEVISNPYQMDEDMAADSAFVKKVRDDVFAQSVYAALCNVSWRKNGIEWSCSWRAAGGLVADLRGKGDYLDFYCSGIGEHTQSIGEGHVTEAVREALALLGWVPDPADVANNLGVYLP